MAELSVPMTLPCAGQLPRIAARGRRGVVFLSVSEVWAFEACNRLCFVHSVHGQFDIDLSLREVEASPVSDAFLRVHRNWLANMEKVREIGADASERSLLVGEGLHEQARTLRVPVSRELFGEVRRTLLAQTVGLRSCATGLRDPSLACDRGADDDASLAHG